MASLSLYTMVCSGLLVDLWMGVTDLVERNYPDIGYDNLTGPIYDRVPVLCSLLLHGEGGGCLSLFLSVWRLGRGTTAMWGGSKGCVPSSV